MVTHNNYNFTANEGFVIFLTSKLITWFFYCFNLKMNSQSIAYILNETEHNILDFGPWRWSALHMRFVDKWPSRIQEQWSFRSRADGQQFSVGSRKFWFFCTAAAPARLYLPRKVRGRRLTSSGPWLVLENVILVPPRSCSDQAGFTMKMKVV